MEAYLPINDGVDHINVYSKGQTKLGRDLSNFADIPVTVQGHGQFASLEGYWYWLSTGMQHDALRNLVGYAAKQYGSKLPKVMMVPVAFQALIKNAINLKIVNNTILAATLRQSHQPLTHYYWYGDIKNPKVIYLPEYQWMIDHITLIRAKLQTPISASSSIWSSTQ